ncbi:MAG: ABC transporter ATP-binding protein, partial [Ignisphaera sp.]|nr:ABC transporter ATP-binding protein [Ignisphaera sp.]MDW8086343.1 ABC transporter ATP-binding protein [Ignisphaera sp.]
MNILEVKNLKAYYFTRGGTVRAIDGVDLYIDRKAIIGIVGESGCGKSTLARVLSIDVVPPLKIVSGEITIEGMNVSAMPHSEVKKQIAGIKVALIPQSAMNALVPTARIKDFIKDVVKEKLNYSTKEILKLAKERFEELNLPPTALDMYPFELSGGMRQRALIAIATLLNPTLLIADEPTSALDVSTQKMVLETLFNIYKRNLVKTILFISHDIATVRQIAETIIVMYAGKIVEIGPVRQLISEPFHPYSRGLLFSILTPEPQIKERVEKVDTFILKGEPPSLINPPPGCRFHPRCPYAMDVCRREEPPIIEVGKDRLVSCWLY